MRSAFRSVHGVRVIGLYFCVRLCAASFSCEIMMAADSIVLCQNPSSLAKRYGTFGVWVMMLNGERSAHVDMDGIHFAVRSGLRSNSSRAIQLEDQSISLRGQRIPVSVLRSDDDRTLCHKELICMSSSCSSKHWYFRDPIFQLVSERTRVELDW